MAVLRTEGRAGTRCCATLDRRTRKRLYLTVKGTAEIDRAWERLETAAETQAGETHGLVLTSGLWSDETEARYVWTKVISGR